MGVATALLLGTPGISPAGAAPTYAQITNTSLVFQGQPTFEIGGGAGQPWQIRNMVTKQVVQTGTVDASQTVTPDLTAVGSYRLEIGETRAHFAIVGDTPVDDSFYGAVTHHQWPDTRAWGSPDTFLPDLKKVGISSVRDGGYWDEIESTRGQYELPAQVEDYFGAVQATGTDQTFLATWTNGLYGMEYRVPPQTSEQRQAYAAYILDTIAKNPAITRVEVWNEFNHEGFNKSGCLTGTCYVEAFAETADIIRAARPDIEVVGGVIAGVSPTWFKEFFAAGGGDHFDAVSWHPYRMMDMLAYEQQVTAIDAIQDEYLQPGQERLNYVISEVGWSTSPLESEGNTARAKDDLVLAERLVYTYMLNDALDVDSVYWYVAANRGGNSSLTEQNFGLFYSATDRITANQPKPATVALWNMRDQVQGLEVTESGRLAANDRIWKTEYSSNTPERIVLWSINNMAPELPADIAAIDVNLADVVPAGMRAVSAVDAYGTPVDVDTDAVSVSSRAVYLTVAPLEPEPTPTTTPTATVTAEPTVSIEPTSTPEPTSAAPNTETPTPTASATPVAVVSITPAATPGANAGDQVGGPDALATTGSDLDFTGPAVLGLSALAFGAALLVRRRNELAADTSAADETA